MNLKEITMSKLNTEILFCRCGITIPVERSNLGYKVCVPCSDKNYVKPKGVMVYGHKTGAEIQILSQDQFNEHRRYNPYGRNTGRGSGLHRVTKTTSSI
jgi:hypothetical protein